MSGVKFKEAYLFNTLEELRAEFFKKIPRLLSGQNRRIRIKRSEDGFQWRLLLDSKIKEADESPCPPLPCGAGRAGHGAGGGGSSASAVAEKPEDSIKGGTYGDIIFSKKEPEEAEEGLRYLKKILKLDSYILSERGTVSPEELLFISSLFFKEFHIFTLMNPLYVHFKFSLEIKGGSLLAARFRMPQLGTQTLWHYFLQFAPRPCEPLDPRKIFHKFAAGYSITSQLLSQLKRLSELGSSVGSCAHLDLKSANVVVASDKDDQLPRAFLIDYGAALAETEFSDPEFIRRVRTTVRDARELCFPGRHPYGYFMDAFSLGIVGFASLGLYDYHSQFLSIVEGGMPRIKNCLDETLKEEMREDLALDMEEELASDLKDMRKEAVSFLALVGQNHPVFLIHWKAAFEVLLWLAEIKPENRLGLENFLEIAEYLKNFSEDLYAFLKTDLSQAPVFRASIPGILLERLSVKYPSENFSGLPETFSSGVLMSAPRPLAPPPVVTAPVRCLEGLGLILEAARKELCESAGSHPFAAASSLKHGRSEDPEEGGRPAKR